MEGFINGERDNEGLFVIHITPLALQWNLCERTFQERDNLFTKDTFHISNSALLLYGVIIHLNFQ